MVKNGADLAPPPVFDHSPDTLGDANERARFTAELWEAFDRAADAKAFYEAAAALIYHARHLYPAEHAILAERLRQPFKPRRGRPFAVEIGNDADRAARLLAHPPLDTPPPKHLDLVCAIAKAHQITKGNARYALAEAEKRLERWKARNPVLEGVGLHLLRRRPPER